MDVAVEGAGGVGGVEAELDAEFGQGAEVASGDDHVAELHGTGVGHFDELFDAQGAAVGGGETEEELHLGQGVAVEGCGGADDLGAEAVEALPGAATGGVDEVVVGGRAPEVGAQGCGEELVVVVAVGGDAAVGGGDGEMEAVAVDANEK